MIKIKATEKDEKHDYFYMRIESDQTIEIKVVCDNDY